MHALGFTRLVLLILLFLVATGCKSKTASTTEAAPPKSAATPEEAVRQLEEAYHTGNYEDHANVLPKLDRERALKLRDAIEAMSRAHDAFEDALDARFGKDPRFPRPEKPDFARRDPTVQIEIVGKTVKAEAEVQLKLKLTSANKTEEIACTAVKEEDNWRLSLGSVGDGAIEMFERQAKAYEEVTAEVKAGKYQSRLDAMKAQLKLAK